MKLRYWYCEHLTDSQAYAIIAKSKKEAQAELDALTPAHRADFGEPQLRVIHYKDAFDLLERVTGEDGGRGYGEEKDDR